MSTEEQRTSIMMSNYGWTGLGP